MMKSAALATVLAGLTLSAANAAEGVEIGVLTCDIRDVDNLVVYTEQEFDCVFDPTEGADQAYVGKITKLGLDLSVKKDMEIVWGVFAPSQDAYSQNVLAGTYVGAGTDVSIGKGIGANVLVGGGADSFSLQPVSVAGVDGVGASLGIESFELQLKN